MCSPMPLMLSKKVSWLPFCDLAIFYFMTSTCNSLFKKPSCWNILFLCLLKASLHLDMWISCNWFFLNDCVFLCSHDKVYTWIQRTTLSWSKTQVLRLVRQMLLWGEPYVKFLFPLKNFKKTISDAQRCPLCQKSNIVCEVFKGLHSVPLVCCQCNNIPYYHNSKFLASDCFWNVIDPLSTQNVFLQDYDISCS